MVRKASQRKDLSEILQKEQIFCTLIKGSYGKKVEIIYSVFPKPAAVSELGISNQYSPNLSLVQNSELPAFQLPSASGAITGVNSVLCILWSGPVLPGTTAQVEVESVVSLHQNTITKLLKVKRTLLSSYPPLPTTSPQPVLCRPYVIGRTSIRQKEVVSGQLEWVSGPFG